MKKSLVLIISCFIGYSQYMGAFSYCTPFPSSVSLNYFSDQNLNTHPLHEIPAIMHEETTKNTKEIIIQAACNGLAIALALIWLLTP